MQTELGLEWQTGRFFGTRMERWSNTNSVDLTLNSLDYNLFNITLFNCERDHIPEGTIYFTNIFFLLSFLVGAVSISTMIALSVNAVIAADITAYTLVATSMLSIIGGVGMIGMENKYGLKRESIGDAAKNTGIILISTLVGYLSYHIFITNSILNSMPILGQAGISAGFSLIIPIIGSAFHAFDQWSTDNIKLELPTRLLPWLIGTALGTFSAVAMNIETDSMMLNMATEALIGCAIAIVTTVVLSWFLKSIIVLENKKE